MEGVGSFRYVIWEVNDGIERGQTKEVQEAATHAITMDEVALNVVQFLKKIEEEERKHLIFILQETPGCRSFYRNTIVLDVDAAGEEASQTTANPREEIVIVDAFYNEGALDDPQGKEMRKKVCFTTDHSWRNSTSVISSPLFCATVMPWSSDFNSGSGLFDHNIINRIEQKVVWQVRGCLEVYKGEFRKMKEQRAHL